MAKRKAKIENDVKPKKQQKTKKRITPDLVTREVPNRHYDFFFHNNRAREVPASYMRDVLPYMNQIRDRIYGNADKWKHELRPSEQLLFFRPRGARWPETAFDYRSKSRAQPGMIKYQTEAARDVALQDYYRNLHSGLRYQGKTMSLVGGIKNYVPPSTFTGVNENLKEAALELRRLGGVYQPEEEVIL